MKAEDLDGIGFGGGREGEYCPCWQTSKEQGQAAEWRGGGEGGEFVHTPRYLLLTKGNIKEGTKALSRLRGTSRVDGELYEILNEEKLLTEHVENYGSFGDSNEHLIGEKSLSVYDLLTSSKYYLSLFVCACVQISQQATGITVLLFYSTSFFQDAGLGCNVSRYATIRYL